MTQRRKWVFSVTGGMLVTCLITIGPWPLDRHPDSKPEADALQLITRMGNELHDQHVARSLQPFKAGWATEAFDLPQGIPLAGYGSRLGAASTGVMAGELLAARSLVLQSSDKNNNQEKISTVAIICTDLLLVNAPNADAVYKQVQNHLGSQTPILLFTATHTHSGPGGWGSVIVEELIAGPHNPDVVEELIRAISKSVIAAVDALAPASYAWIETQAPQYMRNRSAHGAGVDGTLEALVLKKNKGGIDKVALLAVFGAHATCLSDENLELSGDYPGYLVRTLEATKKIDFAAFAAGNTGSHSPVTSGNRSDRVADIGGGLARLLLEQLQSVKFHSTARLSANEFELPTPELQIRFGSSLRASPLVTSLIHQPRAHLSTLRIDDHLWVGVPIEVSGLLSKPLRTYATEAGLSGLTISNFQGDYLGYILPNNLYIEGSAYEAQMSFLGPTGGSYFVNLMHALINTQKPAPQ
ncbi:MAG: neutral/alkaline non-lysosomal ceramidase N-terminal domain-containing protein [Verrucomicrobiota bacterium]